METNGETRDGSAANKIFSCMLSVVIIFEIKMSNHVDVGDLGLRENGGACGLSVNAGGLELTVNNDGDGMMVDY